MSGAGRENPRDRERGAKSGPPARDFTEFGFAEPGGPDALDAYLDGDIDRSSPRFRARFVGDRGFRRELAASEEMIAALKRTGGEPDLSGDILARVHAARPFAAGPRRRLVVLSKLAVAASAVLAVGGLALLERTHPSSTPWASSGAPVSGVVAAAEAPRGAVASGFRAAAGKISSEVSCSTAPTQGAVVPWSGYVIDSFYVSRRCAGHSPGSEVVLASSEPASSRAPLPGPERLLRSAGSLDWEWGIAPAPLATAQWSGRFTPAAPPMPEIVPSWGSPLSMARLGSFSDQFFVTFP